MERQTINVAVVGLGNIGKHHARIYSELKNTRLVAVCDTDKSTGNHIAKRFNTKYYNRHQDLLSSVPIDALSICVPTKIHSQVALYSIDRGKHILIEKPIAASKEDSLKIIQAAEKKPLVLAVGHVERFNPAVQALKKLINEKKFGTITTIMVRRVGTLPPIFRDTDVIIDLAVHDIDICNYLLDKKPNRVYARAGEALNESITDFAGILLEYDDAHAFIQVNWITPVKVRRLNITGTNAYAELDYIKQRIILYKNIYEANITSFGDFMAKFGNPETETVPIQFAEPLKLELTNFIDSVTQNVAPIVTGRDGLAALVVANSALESYRIGRVNEIDYDL